MQEQLISVDIFYYSVKQRLSRWLENPEEGSFNTLCENEREIQYESSPQNVQQENGVFWLPRSKLFWDLLCGGLLCSSYY